MISAERLRELYDASPNVLLRVTDNELRGLGPLIRDVLDELEAARSRISELEGELDDAESEGGEMHSAAVALYMAGRWACDNLPLPEQAALWERLRDACKLPEGTATAAGVAAIILRLGGQTT